MAGAIDDFTFYLTFSKPMVLNLSDAKDRTVAALWLKKLREMNAQNPTDNLHVEYLKLLLFVMQRDKLSGIFTKPPSDGPLEAFPGSNTAVDMFDLVKPAKSEFSGFPVILRSVGGDLCEFVAVQEIPNFGIHGYYAISTEPLAKWIVPHVGRETAAKSASNGRPSPVSERTDRPGDDDEMRDATRDESRARNTARRYADGFENSHPPSPHGQTYRLSNDDSVDTFPSYILKTDV